MKKTNLFLFAFLLLFAFACKDNSTHEPAESEIDFFDLMKDSMDVVDALMTSSNCMEYSLDFSNDKKERYYAELFCDTTGTVRKMVENSMDENGLMHQSVFYFNNENMFATNVSYQKKEGDVLSFVEEYNFYDINKKLLSSYRKTVSDTDEYEMTFEPSKGNLAVDYDRILRAVNNKDEFQLTFQGLIKTDDFDYIIVGEPKKDGFTSALQIVNRTDFINDIYQNEASYINRKIKINFTRAVDGNFSYQVLDAGAWAD